MTELVSLDLQSNGVAILRMQDVTGQNAFSTGFVAALTAQLQRVSAEAAAKVCVIAGLEDVFSAGGSREVLLALADGRQSPYDILLTRTLLEVSVPTIAAMRGHAVGGGLVFGLACDLVVLARESRYGCNFMDLGFTPGMGTTRLVATALGEHVAAEMMFGCRYFKGKHFEGRGHINYVESRATVEQRALGLALDIADKPRYALTILKHALTLPRRRAFEEAATLESLMHSVCFEKPETRNRISENYLTPDAQPSIHPER